MERRGGVILLDRRYGSARITKTLPEWISNRLQHHNRFGSPFAFIRVVAYPVNIWPFCYYWSELAGRKLQHNGKRVGKIFLSHSLTALATQIIMNTLVRLELR